MDAHSPEPLPMPAPLPSPEPEPLPQPDEPPVRIVDLPPDSPAPGIPVDAGRRA
ncbi:MAG TPA: hypothetical protein VFS05_09385 [Gemmatimonadaceae bacterium]|nr:hypothetical protein [Gemmatimonadaceae bacterium]